MRTPTRSPTRCASLSQPYAGDSANPGSSPRCPASATASKQDQTPEARVDRPPGLSVRLKLTLSYAGFLMLASALLLATVWLFLLRYVPDVIHLPTETGSPGRAPGMFVPNQSDLERAFAPRAAQALA